MSTDIADGLMLSAIGLVVAFTFMGIFILIVVVLQKMFPVKNEGAPITATQPETISAISVDGSHADDEQAVIAAIMIALQIARTKRTSTLGAGLESGSGVWWMANQVIARQNGVQIKKSTR